MRLLSPLGEVCHGQSQDRLTVTIKQQKKKTIPHHRSTPMHAQSNSEHMI